MLIKDITDYLESFAPLHYQESYDNAGLIIGDNQMQFKGALICLDITPEVVNECISLDYNMIISHHPLIFNGLKKINPTDSIGKSIITSLKNDIAIYAIHTNIDNSFPDGVSSKMAQKLGLMNLQILDPKEKSSGAENPYGTGIIGEFNVPKEETYFLEFLKQKLNLNCIKYTKLLKKPIRKIAICGGSGSFLLSKAILSGADVFISSDFKYHDYFEAENRIVIANIGHYESEIFTIELIYDKLTNNFNNFAASLTKVVTNPIKYF
jgi:dinuclear metal center YbgI/SA1388 family protein